jgi:hypothetical protein
MAAKRLGSVLTNITGTAGQLLRVKTDESGFEFVTPATIPAYTVSNKTVDRALDCTNSNLDELANVVGTLIDDLMSLGVAGNGSLNTYLIPQFGHSDPGIGSYNSYTITHNLNTQNIMISLQFLNSSDGLWYNINDQDNTNTSDQFGYNFKRTSDNVIVLYIARINWNGTYPCQVRGIVFAPGISAGTPAFQWSTSEQVYPLEKDRSGNTLYCKEIDFGALPNAGTKNVAHGISGLTSPKIFRLEFNWGIGAGQQFENGTYAAGSQSMTPSVTTTNIQVNTNIDLSSLTGMARIIYSK